MDITRLGLLSNYTKSRIFTAVLLVLLTNLPTGDGYLDEMGTCEPIQIEMCSHLKYRSTLMPNLLGHSTQQEAIAELQPYSQLVTLFNCSRHIEFFLCSLFVPMCTMQMEEPLVINVCRSMCLQVGPLSLLQVISQTGQMLTFLAYRNLMW